VDVGTLLTGFADKVKTAHLPLGLIASCR
jgi:hypothetical protein